MRLRFLVDKLGDGAPGLDIFDFDEGSGGEIATALHFVFGSADAALDVGR
jgi:hypothetical protein